MLNLPFVFKDRKMTGHKKSHAVEARLLDGFILKDFIHPKKFDLIMTRQARSRHYAVLQNQDKQGAE